MEKAKHITTQIPEEILQIIFEHTGDVKTVAIARQVSQRWKSNAEASGFWNELVLKHGGPQPISNKTGYHRAVDLFTAIFGTKSAPKSPVKQLTVALQRNCPPTLKWLLYLYKPDRLSLSETEMKQLRSVYESTAQAGYTLAKIRLAGMLHNGQGGQKNIKRAWTLFQEAKKEAEKQKDMLAQKALGELVIQVLLGQRPTNSNELWTGRFIRPHHLR